MEKKVEKVEKVEKGSLLPARRGSHQEDSGRILKFGAGLSP